MQKRFAGARIPEEIKLWKIRPFLEALRYSPFPFVSCNAHLLGERWKQQKISFPLRRYCGL
jgi:hypothetical protein